MGDYWDIDRILYEDHPFNCQFIAEGPSIGWLDPFIRHRGLSDLPVDTKTDLPFWLAEEFTKKGLTTITCPLMYGPSFRDMLQRGSLQLRTKDKSPYYFELGTKFAWLTEDVQLASALIRAITTRLQNIVELTLGNPVCTEKEESALTFPLSVSEEETYFACKAACVDLVQWRAGDSRTIRAAANSILPKDLIFYPDLSFLLRFYMNIQPILLHVHHTNHPIFYSSSDMLSRTAVTFMELKALRRIVGKPRVFLNAKAVRGTIAEKTENIKNAEKSEIFSHFSQKRKSDFSVLSFLMAAKFPEDRATEVSTFFKDFQEFSKFTEKDFSRIPILTVPEQRKIAKFLHRWRSGVFPAEDHLTMQHPKKPPRAWSPEEDNALREAASLLDPSFGDPWFYLAYEFQRDPDDIGKRFLEIEIKPKMKERKMEINLTSSAKPLLMNRDFKLLPPKIFIIPSKENFNVFPLTEIVSEEFQKYRDASVF